jgi:hypothetical protein
MVTGTGTNNCVASASQVILVTGSPVMNVTASDIEVCKGGASTLSVTGANTYQWSSNAASSTNSLVTVNPTTSETYTVVGMNTAGCHSETTVAVAVFEPIISVSSNTSVCLGSTAQLSASGADSYVWSSGQGFAAITVTPSMNSVYTVTGTASQNGLTCEGTNTVSVGVMPNPTVTASSTRSAICISESAIITATGAATYTWSTPSGPLSGGSITVTPVIDQTYSLSGVDANGCKGTSTFQLKVAICAGLEAHALNSANVIIYPNPSSGEFTISADQTIDLRIVNELGQEVKAITLNSDAPKATVTNLASGVYFIIGKNANGIVKEKIIVTK